LDQDTPGTGDGGVGDGRAVSDPLALWDADDEAGVEGRAGPQPATTDRTTMARARTPTDGRRTDPHAADMVGPSYRARPVRPAETFRILGASDVTGPPTTHPGSSMSNAAAGDARHGPFEGAPCA
jgi:hypothetical protein